MIPELIAWEILFARPQQLCSERLVPALYPRTNLLTSLFASLPVNKFHLGIAKDFRLICALFIVLFATLRIDNHTHVSARCLF